MAVSRKARSHATQYRWRTPRVVVWSGAGALAVAAALGVAWLVGTKNQHPKTLDALPAGIATTGAALAIALTALVLFTWCMRNLVLHMQAWLPGRIDVAPFTPASVLSRDPADLTLAFRRQLATLQLQAPTPVPGAAPEGDFFDVLGHGSVDAGNLLATLLNFMRAGVPTHAYEVRGALNESTESPCCSLTVQVVELPSQAAVPIAVHGNSWDAVLTEAADEATAAILPRTRRCRAPWHAWRGLAMPRGLVHHYEQASRFEQERRYDEALREYYAAAELDPMNVTLRLRLGQLQERMGLFLDALDTYRSIEETTHPAESRGPLWLYRGAARRQRRRALFSARYRRIVLLGGRVLAEQWRTPPLPQPSRRDQQRMELRRRLRPYLQRELSKLSHVSSDEIKAALAEGDLDERPDNKQDEDAVFLGLRDLLARYAIREAERLRWQLQFHVFDRRTTLTPATVLLTRECIRLRRDWLRHARKETPHTWPPEPVTVSARIAKIERSGLRSSFRLWHEHYNAACAYALALQGTDVKPERRSEFARQAVLRLQRATTRADSGYIASRRDWLVSEDPDLKGLRDTPEFKDFEVTYLPASKATPRRPKNVQQLESSRYMNDLLVGTARVWQTGWHRRARELDAPPDIHQVLAWFTHELEMWRRVRAVAQDYRHTGTRLELINAVEACSTGYGLTPPAVGFPRYEDDPLRIPADQVDAAAKQEVEDANTRLGGLWCELKGNEPEEPAQRLLDELMRWQTTLRLFDATSRAPSRYFLAQLCDHHAAMWQLLERWLTAEGAGSAQAAQDRFQAKVIQTRRLWSALLAAWRPLSEALAAAADDTDPYRLSRAEVLRAQALARAWQLRYTAGLWVGSRAAHNGSASVTPVAS